MNNKTHISIVSPVYQAESIVPELVKQIIEHVSTLTTDFEIILVNDASPDHSWKAIVDECGADQRIKGINLSRNFGQHYAITAGLQYAKGEWVVVMDCDLQDRPDEIPHLYKKAMTGFDSVFAQRTQRNDSISKKMFSKLFYILLSYLTETKQDSSVANFGIYRRCVIQAVLSMKDQIRYFPTMVQWVGFKKAYLPITHDHRSKGESSYTLKKLLNLALDNIVSFSNKPLKIMAKFGIVISFLALLTGLSYLIGAVLGLFSVEGFASLIISLWFLSGIIILLLGILGIYSGKIFDKVKERPVFIVRDTENL